MSKNEFNKGIGFKVTMEFTCPNMIDKEALEKEFGGDLMKAYKFISDDFRDSPYNYSTREDVIKVEELAKKEEKSEELIQELTKSEIF